MAYDPLDADADLFRPPKIPTLVGCLHCQQSYESYLIEWRVEQDRDGGAHGFWCCPVPGCDGKGFGFDILPIDPTYQDENGGWVHCDDDSPLEGEIDPDVSAPGEHARPDDDEDLPF
jgi:hypothetical protein